MKNTKMPSNAQETSEKAPKVCTDQKWRRFLGKTVPEVGGPKGPEPTRYGDWEKNGRATDFWRNPVNGHSNLKGFKAFLPIETKTIFETNDLVNMNILRIETY